MTTMTTTAMMAATFQLCIVVGQRINFRFIWLFVVVVKQLHALKCSIVTLQSVQQQFSDIVNDV